MVILMSINWYPGHMAKTKRLMLTDLKNIDIVCEIIDARIPQSSRNKELLEIFKGKRHMLAINRIDQANPEHTAKWASHYRAQGYTVIETDSQKGGFLKRFTDAVAHACADLIERSEAKGQKKTIRIMIIGIPNVGKSSFINRLLGKKSAVAADRPGVTRGKQWFTLEGGFDFMDTPGMLWPKIEDDATGYKLAFTGTIRDEILDIEDLACQLITTLHTVAPNALKTRYGIDSIPDEIPYETLERMAKARGFLMSGGHVNTERMSRVFIDEYRGGKLGRITLELPVKASEHDV